MVTITSVLLTPKRRARLICLLVATAGWGSFAFSHFAGFIWTETRQKCQSLKISDPRMAKLFRVIFVQMATAWEPTKHTHATSCPAPSPYSSGFSMACQFTQDENERKIIAFCVFVHHFLQFLKKKKISLIFNFWGNETSPSPGA